LLSHVIAMGLAIRVQKWAGFMKDPSVLWIPAVTLIASYALIFGLFRINETIWRYAGEIDYLHIAAATLSVSTAFALALRLSNSVNLEVGLHLLAILAAAVGVTLSRILYRAKTRRKKQAAPKVSQKLLIVGAGRAASAMISEIAAHPGSGLEIVGLVDDDKEKIGRSIGGFQNIQIH
jgi:FlaA1/EpsC-like NDP-sugar epimerase